jgi:hypothetical protein
MKIDVSNRDDSKKSMFTSLRRAHSDTNDSTIVY